MHVKLGSWNKPSHPRRPGVRLSRREKGKVDETGAREGNETFTLKKKKNFIPLNLEELPLRPFRAAIFSSAHHKVIHDFFGR